MNSNFGEREYLSGLRREVERKIDTYVYKVPEDAIGSPMTHAAIAVGLAQMRASLVDPYWMEVEVRDTFEQSTMSHPPRPNCAVVADDGKGILLLYDPVDGLFALVERRDAGLTTFGVRGAPVGCFLTR
jgi:hypothetical protein